MVSTDQVLDSSTIATIDKIGHSRIPIFKGSDRNIITGFLFVKKLITCLPDTLLGECTALRVPIYVDLNQSLFEILDMFQSGKSHIAIVSPDSNKLLNVFYTSNRSPTLDCAPCGILTIEDVFEALLQDQIYDEDDVSSGNRASPTVMSAVLLSLAQKQSRKTSGNHSIESSSSTNDMSSSVVKKSGIFKRSQTTTGVSRSPGFDNDFKATSKVSLLSKQSSNYIQLEDSGISIEENL
jgi:hypothetical protein